MTQDYFRIMINQEKWFERYLNYFFQNIFLSIKTYLNSKNIIQKNLLDKQTSKNNGSISI